MLLGLNGLGFVEGDWGMPFPNTSSSDGHSTRDLIFGTINSAIPIFAQAFGNNPIYQQGNGQPQYATNYGATPGSQISQGVGAGISNTLGGIGNFLGVSPTTVIIGGAAGLWLLFRQPPRRR
jgi:hypothetical protein